MCFGTFLGKIRVELGFSGDFVSIIACFLTDLAKSVFKNLPFFTFFSIFSAFLPFFPKNDHDLMLFGQK